MKDITASSKDLELVRKLNNEAFPLAERVSIDELLTYTGDQNAHLFGFYDEDLFVGFVFLIVHPRLVYISFFAVDSDLRGEGYGHQILKRLQQCYQRPLALEIERLDEPSDNLDQRSARLSFYEKNHFRKAKAYLEYEGLSFEILHQGERFDEEAYCDIFQQMQEKYQFDFDIRHYE